MIVKAYFKRHPDSIDGLFTLQTNKRELFTRIPARSGQKGYENEEWVRGKGPVPKGKYHLWLHLQKPNPMFPDKPDGIGEFYQISSAKDNQRLIQDPTTPHRQRWDIGLHPENAYPGSAGCIVLLHNEDWLQAYVAGLFEFLRWYGKKHRTIELEVL